MASKTNVDSRQNLTVEPPPPPPIPKVADVQGSDNPIPLSPQWLLPKPGDNKLGMESHVSPRHGTRPDAVKVSGNGENFHSMEKKGDVFRPSFYDPEGGRCDRWRDEERETNSVIRRDRWREGKELGDTRKIERWTDNSSRVSGDARRAPSERWSDSGNRETNYDQRRESKWNTRWGPDDKEAENWREKRSDSGKETEDSHDKGVPHIASHGRDVVNLGKDTDKEGDHYSRSWRSNSSLTRGRGESPHYQPAANKQTPMFSYGRGRGENGPSVSSAGHGRVSSNTSIVNIGASRLYPLGTVSDKSDKSDSAYGVPYTLRYSRMKLLDIFRMTDIKSHRSLLKEFLEVPSLTLEDSLEPMALSAPTSEELAILKGIDKGDIVSSGTPQVSKDGSVGRTSGDAIPSKLTKLGSREDSPYVMGDYKDENPGKIKGEHFSCLAGPSNEKYLHQHGLDARSALNENVHLYQENKLNSEAFRAESTTKKADEFPTRDASILECPSSNYSVPQRSQSVGEHSHRPFHDRNDLSAESRSRTSDMGWSHVQKDLEDEQKNSMAVSSPCYRDESHWQNREDFHPEVNRDSIINRQSAEFLDQERELSVSHGKEDHFMSNDKSATQKFQPYPSPEELSLYYKDPQGQIQGPFSGSDLIGWFDAGYFGIDLQVRLASAPADAPFLLLGDVMPHLRMKARPPPGFGAAKPHDLMELSSRQKVTPGNIYQGINDVEIYKNGQGNKHEASIEAENRFLESLMSGNLSTSPSTCFPLGEVMQGHGGNSPGNMHSAGGERGSDLNFLLSQRLSLERQRSLPNPPPYWPAREISSMSLKKDVIPDSPIQPSKLLPSVGDTRHIPQSPQQVDLLSILQAAAEKSPPPNVNSAVPGWSNFPEARPLNTNVHGGMDILKDTVDLYQNQHFAPQAGFGAQQQRLQPQNQPSLSHLMCQPGDFSSTVVPPEKFPPSEVPQDPQILSLLQQQYLLSQLQVHPQAVPSQLSLLDKILLLKQQQQKQEQQQQQLLLQQQQLLLTQVLSGHQSHQLFGEPSYGLLKPATPAGNTPLDHLGLHQMHEAFQINQQIPVPNLHDGRVSNLTDLSLQGSQDVNYTVSSGPSALHMPQQMFDQTAPAKEWDPTVTQYVENSSISEPLTTLTPHDSFSSEAIEKSSQEAFVPQKNGQEMDNHATQEKLTPLVQTSESISSVILEAMNSIKIPEEVPGTSDFASSIIKQVCDMKISLDDIPEQGQVELPLAKEVKSVEAREGRKVSEKKSKKPKNSKTVSATDIGKGSLKIVSCQPSNQDVKNEGTRIVPTNSEAQSDAEESIYRSSSFSMGAEQSIVSADSSLGTQQALLSSSINILDGEYETVEGKSEYEEAGTSAFNFPATAIHRAWKPASGLKAKSLLEIQQEEKRKAQAETKVSETVALVTPSAQPTPWVGVVANVESKSSKDAVQGASSTQSVGLHSRKSQLHDLLAEEVLAKSNAGATDASATDDKVSSLPPIVQTGSQVDIPSFDDDDFVEAKDTKKSRKKAAKVKGAGIKASSPVTSVDISAPSISLEKVKNTRQSQVEKESLPVPPVGPSLGDFVLWKGDQANSIPAPAAWSTDMGKLQKPTSLRDILREQETKTPSAEKQISVRTPAKAQPNQGSRGVGSSRVVSGSSPSKATSAVQPKAMSSGQISMLISAQSKSRTEDDLFWGPSDQPKQETKRSDFPLLMNSGSWGAKSNIAKGAAVGASGRQKPLNIGSGDHASSVPGHSISKGRKDATKHSEAMDFREWCENELVKLTGTRDTSFLEYCLKQSTSEAEMLLRENLGSLDRNHEFIDKFLNYKDFLSPDVIEIAFQAQSSHKVFEDGLGNRPSSESVQTKDFEGDMESGLDGTSKGGKRKGKKGKKVMPSAVLGFNVVSNRIMMGEIQTVDD